MENEAKYVGTVGAYNPNSLRGPGIEVKQTEVDQEMNMLRNRLSDLHSIVEDINRNSEPYRAVMPEKSTGNAPIVSRNTPMAMRLQELTQIADHLFYKLAEINRGLSI